MKITEVDSITEQFAGELRVVRARHGQSLKVWSKAVGIDQSVLSRLQRGVYMPRRDQILEWGPKWGLTQEEEGRLLISGGMIPRLPNGFGTDRDDLFIMRCAIQEIYGAKDREGFIEMVQGRIAELSQPEQSSAQDTGGFFKRFPHIWV